MTPDELHTLAATIRMVADAELRRLATIDLVRLAPHQRDEHTERHERMGEMAALDDEGAAEIYATMCDLFDRELSVDEAVALIQHRFAPPIKTTS